MDKLSMDEEDYGAIHNVESFVLDRLLTQQLPLVTDHSISMGVLTESLDVAMSPLFDQAIQDLLAQSLIYSEYGENFEITQDGINELENRKKEAIPL